MTVTEWLEANLPGGAGSLLGRALGIFTQSFFGLEPGAMSAINLFEAFVVPYPGADERFRVAGGNDTIVQGLQRALPSQAIVTGHGLEAAWTRGRTYRPPVLGRDSHRRERDPEVEREGLP